MKILGGAETVTADAAFGSGLFAAHVNLAAGSNTLTASAEDAAGNASSAVTLVITSNPNAPTPPAGEPYQINISTGSEQRGLNGAEFPRPLIAVVTDVQGNPVPNALVTFTTVQGAGRFIDGNPSFQVSSDADGHASSRYVSGNTDDVYLIRADFSGDLSTPAVFVEESAQGGNATTVVSGIVLDQNLRALPNVLVRIGGQQTRCASDGRFRVSNVPAGPHQLLELIGRDQIPFPGRWPNITYDFDVLAGVDNNLGRPLFLFQVNGGVSLPLDNNNIVTQDTIGQLLFLSVKRIG